MGVKVADAFIALCLDTTQLEQDWQAIKSRIEADCIKICIDMSGVQAAQAQAARVVTPVGLPAQSSVVSSAPAQAALTASSIAGLFADPTPESPGWSLMDDLTASANLVANVGLARFGGTRAGQAIGVIQEMNNARLLGDSLMQGVNHGMRAQIPQLEETIEEGIFRVLETGKEYLEARSPSRKAGREIGSPIMQGVELAILTGAPAVAAAMVTSLGFAFNSWKAAAFGGTFVGPGLNTVANPGGMLGGGLGGYLGQLGTAMQVGMIQANPTNLGEASRSLLGQFPMQARNFGQNLLSGALESALPGWAAGPLGDMVGTYFGLKPIITAQDALGASKSADAGGFADYPYGGGQFVFNNTFNGVGNFTDVEREVQLGILTSMRRLGA